MKKGKRTRITKRGNHLKEENRKENKLVIKKLNNKKFKLKKIIGLILLIIALPFAAVLEILKFTYKRLLKPLFKFIIKYRKRVLIISIIIFIILGILKGIFTYTNSLNSTLQGINSRLDNIDLQLNDMTEKDQKLQEDLNLLSEQNGTTLQELEQKKKELEEKQSKVDKLQSEVNDLQKQVTSRGGMTSRSSNSISESNKSESNNKTQVTVSTNEHQSYAHDLCINTYGWSEYDFTCLVKLWNRESGWNPNAHNKSSGAHGIAQALPASKMASEGSDYYTNGKTQIRWGLKYIKNRYGSPASAWAHSESHRWY